MHIELMPDPKSVAEAAARHAARVLRSTLELRGRARLVAATGSSQIDFLAALSAAAGIDWTRVELFHLDEYVGISPDHPASFCRFLQDRLIRPAGIERYHLLDGRVEAAQLIADVGAALTTAPIDLLLAGIGENGHLAFNEPPADFATPVPYLVVELDPVSRQQQVNEGWFATFGEVPVRAITMSVRQILSAREILCLVHGSRKARAVHDCFVHGVTAQAPASILRTHAGTTVYLDEAAAGRLPGIARGPGTG